MIYSALLLGMGLAASRASAECTRAMLQESTAEYIEAQAAGEPGMPKLASDVKYLENDESMDIAKGILAQAVTIDLNRTLLDTTQCATFIELSAATNAHPYVIHTRMLFTDGEITDIQSVVTDADDWAFNAAGNLKWNQQEEWDPIPEDERDSREAIQAAGDAYLDSWGDSSVSVPYGAPCARLEGGMYTGDANTKTNTCEMPEFPEPLEITNRRYVVDEEMGAVDIFNNFPFIDQGKPDGTPSTNFIRVEGGKIRYIHEVTACTTPNCSR